MAGEQDYYNYDENANLGNIMQRLGFNDGQPTPVQVDAQGQPEKPSDLVGSVATALARSIGGAAGGMGSDARPEAAGEAPARQDVIRYFDDRTERPQRSLKDMALLGLIPLGAGVLGGALNGKKGALAGASAGTDAVAEQVQGEDKRFNKLEDDKAKIRSQLTTARLMRELGGKDGAGSINKNRYQKVDGIDAQTGQAYSYTFDRQEGKAGPLQGLDGIAIPYTSDIYKRFRPNPGQAGASPYTNQSPGVVGQAAPDQPLVGSDVGGTNPVIPPQSKAGGSAGSSGTFVMPRPAPPAADSGTFRSRLDAAAPPPGVTTKLPGVKKPPPPPAAAAVPGFDPAPKQAPSPTPAPAAVEPAIASPANVPPGRESDSIDQARIERDAIVDMKNQQIAAAKADLDPKQRAGESLLDAETRHKDAQKQITDAQKSIDTENADYAKHVARVAEQKDQAARRQGEKATNPRNDPQSELNITNALDKNASSFRNETAKIRQAIQSSGRISTLADQALTNPMAAAAIGRQLARAAGEVGVLTDADVRSFQGSQALTDRWNRFVNKTTSGETMTPADLKEAKDLAAVMKQTAQKDIDDHAQMRVDSFIANHPAVPKDRVFRVLTGRPPPDAQGAAMNGPAKGEKRSYGGKTWQFMGGENKRENWKEVTN